MKKIVTAMLAICCFISANAQRQQALQGTKVLDNWSIGLNGGVTQPLAHPYSLGENIRPTVGVEIYKQFTPVLKLGLGADFGINTTGVYGNRGVRTAFDNSNVSLLGGLNLMNMFGGYKGEPRLFEIEALGGIGWGHTYGAYATDGPDYNYMTTKFGLNLNFNIGEEKAWTIAVRPAIVYDIEGRGAEHNNVKFNSDRAWAELTAGVVYHFRTSNGKHHFTYEALYDQMEVDALNSRINSLRSQLSDADDELAMAHSRIGVLENKLEECSNRQPVEIVRTVTETKTSLSLESIVTFRQGRTSIDASQYPNVERVATYLNNHRNAVVVIKGYASPEGSAEVNERIANQRAQAVKDMLVKKYRIDSRRITAEGQGIGDMFSEPDWNRVSVCTLIDETE